MAVSALTTTKVNPGLRAKLRHKRRIIVGLWTLWFAYLSLTHEVQPVSAIPAAARPGQRNIKDREDRHTFSTSLKWRAPERFNVPRGQLFAAEGAGVTSEPEEELDESNLVAGYNCTNPSILEFPPDLFTQDERQAGAIAIHFIASLYLFYAIALVCDDYFVPSIEAICEDLHLPSDVAGATFMAIATSSPELFTNVIGTFITEGDIGVGTIVGSAVFNILAVCACCGFAASAALPLDWYPLTRDCIFYSISVILLIVVLENQKVFWYEALVLVIAYALYIVVMWKNTALKRFSERTVGKIARYCGCFRTRTYTSKDEKTPLLKGDRPAVVETKFNEDFSTYQDENADPNSYDEILIAKALHHNEEEAEEEQENYNAFSLPRGESCWTIIEWVLGWPARFVFTLTIPDCRRTRFRRMYPLTFIMCIVYIALLSYVVSWLMTIIGHTFRIPDSVMGLTFIAAGTSVPEAVSSIIVAKQGLGSMSISNSIGSNTFDILMCLGLPWLIRASMLANEVEGNFIQINSGGLEYSAIILMVSLVLLYGLLAVNGFYLDKKVAVIATILYAIFLVFASLLEMNVFFVLNQPTCSID